MTGLPTSQSRLSAASSFAKSFYGLFTRYFPEDEPSGIECLEDSPHPAGPPALAPPETFFLESQASSFVQGSVLMSQYVPRAESSILVEAPESSPCVPTDSIVIPRCESVAMTPYGPAPQDMRSHHRTTFGREQLVIHELHHQYVEQSKRQEAHFKSHTKSQQDKPQRQSPREQQKVRQAAHQADKAAVSVEDVLDQHVDYYLSQHPRVAASGHITRKHPGCYTIYGREVRLDWEHNDTSGGPGFLVVIDGPLRQAFSEYVAKRSSAGESSREVARSTNLQMLPKDARMTFQEDSQKKYTRVEAMKVAKEQMLAREQAAYYVNAGCTVPTEIMDKYQQALEANRLGKTRHNYEGSQRKRSEKAKEEKRIPVNKPELPPPGAMNSGVFNSGVFSSAVHR